MAALLPGARVSFAVIGSPASVASLTASGLSLDNRAFCSGVAGSVDARVIRRAEFLRQLLIMHAWIFAGDGSDLGGQQIHDGAVLVRRPHGAVAPQKAGAGTFLAAKAYRAVEQARRKPFEPHRHFATVYVLAG